MICGANSDLFGRRWFIIGGNIFVFVGSIVGATSHSLGQSIAAHVLLGIGAGNCQMVSNLTMTFISASRSVTTIFRRLRAFFQSKGSVRALWKWEKILANHRLVRLPLHSPSFSPTDGDTLAWSSQMVRHSSASSPAQSQQELPFVMVNRWVLSSPLEITHTDGRT